MRTKKLFFLCIPAILVSLAGCFGDDVGDRVEITVWPAQSTYNTDAVLTVIDNYNNGQGKLDGVYVNYVLKDRKYGDRESTSLMTSPTNVDIFGSYDENTKNLVDNDLFANLDDFFAREDLLTKDENGRRVLELNEFAPTSINRFRVNKETHWCGEGETLYALPQMADPSVLYYNEGIFESQETINIISIDEDELDNYNAQNGTSFKAHGYAEYKNAPATGLKKHEGTGVYRVFNNKIGMNWEELEYVSKLFTRSWNARSATKYGMLTEYWFPYGWSVGGDCMNLDPTTNKYVFTLGDKTPNYLVTDNVTINNDTYKKGDVLNYRSKLYVSNHLSELTTELTKLYELPSQYEAFARFVSLTTKKGTSVDDSVSGLGISPTKDEITGGSKINYFTAGDTAMVNEGFEQVNLLNDAMTLQNKKFNVAKMFQYREFEGGSTYNGQLKVIGETYDSVTYTGNLKKVNGTGIKGLSVTSSLNNGWSIPKNSAHKEEAFKFLQYWCGRESQKVLAGANDGVPTISSLSHSSDYVNQSYKPFKNYDVLGDYADNSMIGDWSYLENKDWVTLWSDDLNNNVRNGLKTLSRFFHDNETKVNNKLATYLYKTHGKE